MFVKDSDVLEIKVYYKKVKRNNYEVYTEKEYKAVEKKEGHNELNLKMRELTWGLYNELQEDAMVEDAQGERRFNFKLYKENRLGKLIQSWNAKTEEDKPVSVNSSSIAHLVPEVAETILRAYDEISFVGDEEEKK